MSTFSFTLTLLLLGTIGAAQSDNPVFWLLIGPAPFAVMFTGLVFLRQQFSPKRMGKPVRHLESLVGGAAWAGLGVDDCDQGSSGRRQ